MGHGGSVIAICIWVSPRHMQDGKFLDVQYADEKSGSESCCCPASCIACCVSIIASSSALRVASFLQHFLLRESTMQKPEPIPTEEIKPQIGRCIVKPRVNAVQERTQARKEVNTLVLGTHGFQTYTRSDDLKNPLIVNHGGAENWGNVFFCSVLPILRGYGEGDELFFQEPEDKTVQVVVKTLEKKKLDRSKRFGENPYREIHRMQTIGDYGNNVHRPDGKIHVLGCIEALEDKNEKFLHIVTLYCEGGDLSDRVLWPANWTPRHAADGIEAAEREAAGILRQMMEILEYIHEPSEQNPISVCHRDIKPENFLVTGDGRLVLTDFAMSFPIPNGGIVKDERDFGTVRYLPPEVYGRKPYDAKGCDLWACMVSLINILIGKPLWEEPVGHNILYTYFVEWRGLSNNKMEDLRQTHRQLTELSARTDFPQIAEMMQRLHEVNEIAERINALSDELRELLGNVLLPNSEHRWNRSQVLESKWMQMHAGA
eukprot:scaffold2334_cov118-Cylindrotheca_fusiformis.AAC.30